MPRQHPSQQRNVTRRGIVVIAAVAAALAATGVVFLTVRSPSALSTRLENLPAHQRGDVFSKELNDTLDELRNRLARQRNWTREDAEYLVRTVNIGYSPAAHDRHRRTMSDVEAQMVYNTATATVSERFMIDAPMDDDARVLLTNLLLDQLKNPDWGARVAAISSVVQGGLAVDPAIRRKVEDLTRDPNPAVAANATRQLEHYDRLAAARKGK